MGHILQYTRGNLAQALHGSNRDTHRGYLGESWDEENGFLANEINQANGTSTAWDSTP